MKTGPWKFPLLLCGLLGCHASTRAPDAPAEAMVLKSYDIPPAYAGEINNVVNRLLWVGKDKPSNGSSTVAMGGRLMVAAPEGFQAGVKELVDTLRVKPPAAPPTVFTEVWVVAGRPAAKPLVGASLAELQGMTDALLKQGPMELALVEKLAVMGTSGANVRAKGFGVELGVTASVVDTMTLLDLDIDPVGRPQFSTRVQVPPGKQVVLGQSGYEPVSESFPFFSREPQGSAGMSLFYVVRTRVDAP